ncbi:Protein OSCP1, partial [Trichinella murrelli]
LKSRVDGDKCRCRATRKPTSDSVEKKNKKKKNKKAKKLVILKTEYKFKWNSEKAMSLKALPILIFNMGGEMCYILEQRLKAQKVKKERAHRVMNEIVAAIFCSRFLEQLFEPQELPSQPSMRLLFEKLAHSSIMRLGGNSLDKLYDLMTMMFKYQVQSCASPRHLLVITMNHLDGIRQVVYDSPSINGQIDHAYCLLSANYFSMNLTQLYYIRQNLLNFFQGSRVRVCLLLQEKLQREDGRFTVPLKGELPCGFKKPGAIRLYNHIGQLIRQDSFDPGSIYTENVSEEILEKSAKNASRGSDLGQNIFDEMGTRPATHLFSFRKMSRRECMAKEDLQLLQHLVSAESKGCLKLTLFEDDEEETDDKEQGDENKEKEEGCSKLSNMDSVIKKDDTSKCKSVTNRIRIDATRRSAEAMKLLQSLDISGPNESSTTHSEILLNMSLSVLVNKLLKFHIKLSAVSVTGSKKYGDRTINWFKLLDCAILTRYQSIEQLASC